MGFVYVCVCVLFFLLAFAIRKHTSNFRNMSWNIQSFNIFMGLSRKLEKFQNKTILLKKMQTITDGKEF